MQGQAGKAQADAEQSAALYNEQLTRIAMNEEIQRRTTMARRIRSSNVVATAKSGVRLEGSILDALVESEYQQTLEIQRIRRAGLAQARLLRMQSASAKRAGGDAMQSGLLSGATNVLSRSG